MKTSKFLNSVVIITGAASGMGQHMVIQAAQKGGHVIATDVNEEGLAETQAMAKALGFSIQPQRLDVSNKADINAFIRSSLFGLYAAATMFWLDKLESLLRENLLKS